MLVPGWSQGHLREKTEKGGDESEQKRLKRRAAEGDDWPRPRLGDEKKLDVSHATGHDGLGSEAGSR